MKILLSIKPDYAEKIFSLEKRFEFRKTFFRTSISAIIFYLTTPVKKIVGECDVQEIIWAEPHELWEKTRNFAGISEDVFFNYFTGRDMGIAIKIGSVKRYAKAIDPYKDFSEKFTPPQSFRYMPDFIQLPLM